MTGPGRRITGRTGGFTLLELMVAIAVFSIMSAMAYAGLNTLLTARSSTAAAAERLQQLQLTFHLLQRDLTQITSRSVRDLYGDRLPAFPSMDGESLLFSLTRAGRSNPLQRMQSTLQRIDYIQDQGALYRRSWNVLDQSLQSEPVNTLLMGDISSISLRFMDDRGAWHDHWPLATSTTEIADAPLPRGVELTLKTADLGEFHRLFSLPANAVPSDGAINPAASEGTE